MKAYLILAKIHTIILFSIFFLFSYLAASNNSCQQLFLSKIEVTTSEQLLPINPTLLSDKVVFTFSAKPGLNDFPPAQGVQIFQKMKVLSDFERNAIRKMYLHASGSENLKIANILYVLKLENQFLFDLYPNLSRFSEKWTAHQLGYLQFISKLENIPGELEKLLLQEGNFDVTDVHEYKILNPTPTVSYEDYTPPSNAIGEIETGLYVFTLTSGEIKSYFFTTYEPDRIKTLDIASLINTKELDFSKIKRVDFFHNHPHYNIGELLPISSPDMNIKHERRLLIKAGLNPNTPFYLHASQKINNEDLILWSKQIN